MKEPSVIELMQEIIAEDIEIMREVFSEDLQPLIKYRQKMEREIFNRVYEEVLKLEESE